MSKTQLSLIFDIFLSAVLTQDYLPSTLDAISHAPCFAVTADFIISLISMLVGRRYLPAYAISAPRAAQARSKDAREDGISAILSGRSTYDDRPRWPCR